MRFVTEQSGISVKKYRLLAYMVSAEFVWGCGI